MTSSGGSGQGNGSGSSLQVVVSTVQNIVQSINSSAQSLSQALNNIKPSSLIGNPTASDGQLQAITLANTLEFSGTMIGVDIANVIADIIPIITPSLVPPGMIGEFAMQTPPSGWLICDGSAVSRTTFAALFTAIGTLYGSGDGSTTFNLPPYQGMFLRAWDSSGSIDPSRAFGSMQSDAFASHTHSINDPGHTHTVSDPGHGHGLTDPGHHHTPQENTTGAISSTPELVGQASNFNSGLLPLTPVTTTSTTGITIGNNTTGITNVGSVTGITNAAAGGTETRPKNYAVLVCIRT